MLKVIFNYKGIETVMQCQINETIEEVIKRYKLKIEINNEYYLYNGKILDKNNKIEEIINNEDKINNKMKIIVNDINEDNNNNMIEIKEIICPECNENVIININEYKIGMKCNNNHYHKILIKEYKNKIDISKIKCNKCNKNRNDIYNNELYICLKCKINLCPLCKLNHD